MRNRLLMFRSKSILGHSCHMAWEDQKWNLVDNQETDFLENQRRIKQGYYWFRAPKITLDQLTTTAQNLSHVEDKFQLDVWASTKDQDLSLDKVTFDASLKFQDQIDAATFAWGHTEMWIKWDQDQENQLKKQMKNEHKPLVARVGKDGTIKVRVQVETLDD